MTVTPTIDTVSRAREAAGPATYRFLIPVAFLVSGFCGLVYEVAWARALGIVVGNSMSAVSIVLAAYMGGMALGSMLGGRAVERVRSPLRVYGLLELGVGIFSMASPLLLGLLTTVYVFAGRAVGQSPLALNGLRLVLSLAVLLIPTSLMGATLPALAKHVVRADSKVGTGIGLLYGINTVGAVAGTLLSGFVLIWHVGITLTIMLTASANMAVAIVVLIAAGKQQTPAAGGNSPEHRQRSASPDRSPRQPLEAFLIVAYALSGLAAMAYEVTWTRALACFAGHTTYAFTSILATFLLGLGAGSLLIARASDRIRRPIAAIGVAEVAIGILAVLSIPLLTGVSYAVERLVGLRTWASPVWLKFAYSAMVMLPPTLLLGCLFPLVCRTCVRAARAGQLLGGVYAANTVGGIAGSLLAAFLLIPALGLLRGIALLAALNMAIGITVLVLTPELGRRSKAAILVVSLLVFGVVFAGVAPSGRQYSVNRRIKGHGTTAYYREGLTSTIEVVDRPSGPRDLFIDGELNASSSRYGILVHRMLAQLPLLLHHDPHTVFLVGYGSGMTAGAPLAFDGVRRIACSEISPDIMAAAGLFTSWSHGVRDSARFALSLEDGRARLLTGDAGYDVIVTGIIHPKYNAGNAGLYSRDFYRLCRRHLGDGGVMCQWLPLNALRLSEFKTIIRTFQDVFPHSSLWLAELYGGYGNYNALLIGTQNRATVDCRRLSDRVDNARLGSDLNAAGIYGVFDVLKRFAAGESTLADFCQGAALNTDDRPVLEYGNVADAFLEILSLVVQAREPVAPYLTEVEALGDDTAAVRRRLRTDFEATGLCMAGDVAKLNGNTQEATARYESAVRLVPEDVVARQELAHLGQRPAAVPVPDAWVKAQAFVRRSQLDSGLRELGAAVDSAPQDGDAWSALGYLYEQKGLYDDAVRCFRRALSTNPQQEQTRVLLGIAYGQQGNLAGAEAELAAVLRSNPRSVPALFNLGLTYIKAGQRGEAADAFRKVLAIDPGNQDARQSLAQLEHPTAPE
jgi:spermidine synthase